MSKKILTTTGFLFPVSEHYEVYTADHTPLEAFIGRDNNYDMKTLVSYFTEHQIQHSPYASVLYKNYQKKQSFENFAAMLDFTASVLQGVDCKTFMEWQCYSRHTPPLSLMMCRDLLLGKTERFLQYANSTAQTRFVLNASITKDMAVKRCTVLLDGVPGSRLTWVNVLEPLLQNRVAFLTLFWYFFVSSF